MSQLPQPWLSFRRQCSQTPKYQYVTALPLTLATMSFLPCDKRTKWPPWTKRPISLSNKSVWAKGCIYFRGIYGPRWGTCHPYLNTPGHKAFRSQLTANELGGLRFAGVGPKWSTVQPRSARANPLWQPRALGIWGRYLPTPIGDAGCPWEWPPTDATLRDITLDGLPPPPPFDRKERSILW